MERSKRTRLRHLEVAAKNRLIRREAERVAAAIGATVDEVLRAAEEEAERLRRMTPRERVHYLAEMRDLAIRHGIPWSEEVSR